MFYTLPPLCPCRWPAVKVGMTRPAADALTGSLGTPIKVTGSVPPASSVESAVARQLHGSCAYLMDGWWTYELCHQRHLRQFHVSVDNGIEQIHTLGTSLNPNPLHMYPSIHTLASCSHAI